MITKDEFLRSKLIRKDEGVLKYEYTFNSIENLFLLPPQKLPSRPSG
jgi:hypothetical protein